MTGTLLGVQALRGVAALLVVAYHAVEVWNLRVSRGAGEVVWENGAAGVDMFFVVSGLVMMLSSERLRGRGGAWWIFLRGRFMRVVPLYWSVTLAKICLVAAVPALAQRTRLDAGYVVASLLLLPVHDATGGFRPVLPVGWTLTFEALFYALFALALARRAPVLGFVAPPLAALGLLSLARTPSWPAVGELADPIVLEFVLGVWIGTAALRGRTAPPALACALLAAGFAGLFLAPPAAGWTRLLAWGLPAAAIVAGTVGLERVLAPRLPSWALLLGDASYSTYLVHGFVLPGVGLLVARSGLGAAPGFAATVAGGLVASAAAGVIVHKAVERPLLSRLRRGWRAGVTTGAGGAA